MGSPNNILLPDNQLRELRDLANKFLEFSAKYRHLTQSIQRVATDPELDPMLGAVAELAGTALRQVWSHSRNLVALPRSSNIGWPSVPHLDVIEAADKSLALRQLSVRDTESLKFLDKILSFEAPKKDRSFKTWGNREVFLDENPERNEQIEEFAMLQSLYKESPAIKHAISQLNLKSRAASIGR